MHVNYPLLPVLPENSYATSIYRRDWPFRVSACGNCFVVHQEFPSDDSKGRSVLTRRNRFTMTLIWKNIPFVSALDADKLPETQMCGGGRTGK